MNDATTELEPAPSELRSTINASVREVALLADVTIAVWSGERTDASIMEEAKRNAGATGNVGRAIKNLMAGADTRLKECRSAFSAMRQTHYSLTLPYVSDPNAQRLRGPRLLPNALFMPYLDAMGAKRREANAALDKFCDGYDEDKAAAQANLGTLADSVYPTVEQVRSLFRAEFEFSPIPAGADFVNLPDVILKKLSGTLADRQAAALASAMRGMWETARERVEHLAAVMADPDKTFKESTVEQAHDLAKLLPGWAIDGDPRAHEAAADIHGMLDGVTAKLIRKDGAVRAEIADRARALVAKFNEWGV